MPSVKTISALLAFNRGRVSRLGLARVDIQQKLPWAAEIQTNWMPRALGSMMLRPGLEYTGYGTHNNAYAIHIPFVKAFDDTAIIELTDLIMRVKIDETPITRPSVSSTITNGTFDTDVTGWTDADESGAISGWLGGYMTLTGTGFNAAIRYQAVTISTADSGIEHALNIVVYRNPVTLRVGSTVAGSEYIRDTELGIGNHSLALNPSEGTMYVQFSNRREFAGLVDSVAIASSGVMTIASPWAEDDLNSITSDESVDVVYVACNGCNQYKIERRGTGRSWSIIEYHPEDGPFRSINISSIKMTPDVLSGDGILTASQPFFEPGHLGALFRLDSIGQRVQADLTADGQYTDYIRVTGVGTARVFDVIRSGTWATTLTLQKSVEEPGTWVNVATYTTNGTSSYNDGLDNQIIYYRIGFNTGGWTSGTAVVELSYATGSISGICRVRGFGSSTYVAISVLKNLGGTSSTTDWYEGLWSEYRGYPTAVALDDGRIWWAGRFYYVGSVSGSYESYDDTIEGDSGPIIKTIPYGPVDVVNWLCAVKTLLMGTASFEWSIRSSTLDEVRTPSNTKAVSTSSQGSTTSQVLKVDSVGVFIQNSGTKLYSTGYDPIKENYVTDDLTKYVPEIGLPGFSRMAVQRQPDTRFHCVRSDGTAGVYVLDTSEDVRCWLDIETPGADGEIEDTFILPGTEETKVYYSVKRTINGSTVRYLERWAMESECVGGALNKQADSFFIYDGVATTTITGLDHLEGEEVIVWADGVDLSDGYDDDQVTYTVTSGQVVLGVPVSQAIIGLPYESFYKSTKMAYGGALGTALNQNKRIDHLGLILADTHAKGLRYGPDEDNLDPMPDIEDAAEVDGDTIHESYDREMIEFDGEWDTDSRIVLKAQAPRPCTVLAATVKMTTN